jgi:hypothetical protein
MSKVFLTHNIRKKIEKHNIHVLNILNLLIVNRFN